MSIAAGLPLSQSISRTLMIAISCETMTLLYCNRQEGSTEKIFKYTAQPVKGYDVWQNLLHVDMLPHDDLVDKGQHGGKMGT